MAKANPIHESVSRRTLLTGAAAIPVSALATPALTRPDDRLQLIYELQTVLTAEVEAYANEQGADLWSIGATDRFSGLRIDMWNVEGPDYISASGTNYGPKYTNRRHVRFNAEGRRWSLSA